MVGTSSEHPIMPTLSEVCPGRSLYSALVVIKQCDYGLLLQQLLWEEIYSQHPT